MENYMKEIIDGLCAKLGISLFEEFDIVKEDGSLYSPSVRYYFTHDALRKFKPDEETDDEDDQIVDAEPFFLIARGQCTIKPVQFVPKQGSRYYYVCWNCPDSEAYVTEDTWDGGIFDVYNLIHGNCFPVPSVARTKKKEVYERILNALEERES